MVRAGRVGDENLLLYGSRNTHLLEFEPKPSEKRSLAEALPDLLGSKSTNSIEPETEYQPVFLSQSDVESVILGGDGAAIPTVTECHC